MSDNEQETVDYKPTFVLIAIDTDPSMFVKNEDTKLIPFKECITACYELANSLIFQNNQRSWCPFGVILGTDDVEKASFINFHKNILDSIQFLKTQNEKTKEELKDLYVRGDSFNLSNFFLLCKKKFKEVKSAFYERKIIYITNDSDPTKGNNLEKFAALNEAKNFQPNNISLEVVTMNADFDYTKLYNELFSVIKAPLTETLIKDSDGLVDKLSSIIITRYHQRKVNFFPFLGDQKRFIKVTQKKYIKDERLYNNFFTTKDGKVLKKVAKTTEDSAATYTLEVDSENHEFTYEEYLDMKRTQLPIGYTLIAPAKRSTDVAFVFTDSKIIEVQPKEDPNYFNGFWQYCVDKDLVLLCIRKLKSLDNLEYVELIPKYMSNSRVFLVKRIPFNDNIHPPVSSIKEGAEPTEQDKGIVRNIIDSLTVDYDVRMYINPESAKKKAFLRAKLLDEEQEAVEDTSENNAKDIEERLQGIDGIEVFFDLSDESKSATKRKRGTAGVSATAVSKRKK